MKVYAFVRPGMETISQKEIKEIVKTECFVHNSVVEFEILKKEDLLRAVYHLQSVRKILISCGNYKNLNSLAVENISFPLNDIFLKNCSCKVTVEGVRGQENRIAIAKQTLSLLLPLISKKCGFTPKIDVANPDIIISVFYNDEQYFVGVDVCGKELDSREYRVFPHSGSFKGDMAYYFVRKSGFKKSEKLLVGFAKDGAIAVEAALFASNRPVWDTSKREFSFFSFPLFNKFDFVQFFSGPHDTSVAKNGKNIFAFDESMRNSTSARKNVKIANVAEHVDVSKHDIDDIDVRYSKDSFDRLIFHVTTKDEGRINEIYYQASYVLRKKGTLLLIGRENWDVSVSDKFILLQREEITRGQGKYVSWLLEKK